MEVLNRLEIYIPVEAEVKSIPLWSLPKSVLRRMGLPLSDSEGSSRLAGSPEGIWICPAVIRRKGQKPASQTGNGVMENMSTLLGKQVRAASGPFRMSFVSSNHTAYRVLKDTMPEQKVTAHTSHTSLLPPGSAPQTYKDAVVIYHGRIYLSIRKPNRSQSRRETREPQPAAQSSMPSTSGLRSKRKNKRQSPQASGEPADKLQGKRLHVTLPQITPKQTNDLLSKTHKQSTTDQELLNSSRPTKKHTACKLTHSENRKEVTPQGRGGSSSKTAPSVPQCTDSQRHKDAGGERASEKAAGPGPSWFQQEEVANSDSEMLDLGGEEAESTNQNNDMGSNIQTDSGEPDHMVEQSSNQSWTRRESQGAACDSTSQQYEELKQEEKIARMKAKLKEREAALKNLSS